MEKWKLGPLWNENFNDFQGGCGSGKSGKNREVVLVREKSGKNQGIGPFPWKMPLFVHFP